MARTTTTASSPDPAEVYARRVVAGKEIAGPFVRAACQRHLNDLKTGHERGWRYDRAKAERVLRYFEKYLTIETVEEHADGTKTAKIAPFVPLPWAQFVLCSIFGWVGRDGLRRFRSAYIEGGKGCTKTPLAAGIGLYGLTSDGEISPEVYAAGSKREQSMNLFKDVTRMVNRSRKLKKRLRPIGKVTTYEWRYRTGWFKPLSKDKSQSGPKPSIALVDELHEHKDRYTIDMLQAGFKARTQPLLFVITNAGFDRLSVCYEYHTHAINVVTGMVEDDAHFSFVMSLDPEDDPLEDETCWRKTNPGLGITPTLKYLRQQVAEARAIPGRESMVRRLAFCEWTESEVGWVTRERWKACEESFGEYVDGFLEPPGFEGAECYGAVDLSFSFDMTALAWNFPGADEDEGKALCWIEYFTPLETMLEREKRDRLPYPLWVKLGLVHGVPGKIVRLEHVARRIARVQELYDLRWMGFDRYRHKDLERDMADQGVEVPWIEHPQGFRRGGKLEMKGRDGKPLDNPLWMPESVRATEARVLESTLRVQPSQVTRAQVSAVAVKDDPAGTGNRILDKRKSVGRIDGMVALAMAEGVASMKLPTLSLAPFLANPVMTK